MLRGLVIAAAVVLEGQPMSWFQYVLLAGVALVFVIDIGSRLFVRYLRRKTRRERARAIAEREAMERQLLAEFQEIQRRHGNA